jgi:hypothetical protein
MDSNGRFVWVLEEPKVLEVPWPCRGYQRLWRWQP